MSNKKKIEVEPNAQCKIQTEIWWAVINHLSTLASVDNDDILLKAGMNADLLRVLKNQTVVSMRSLSQDLTKQDSPWDIDQLCKMLVIVGIPKDAQDFLKHGANNRVFQDILGIKGVDMPSWRKAIPSLYRQRRLPADLCNSLWKSLRDYEITNLKAVSPKQMVEMSQKMNVSIAAIWDEICDNKHKYKWDLKK